MKQLFLQMKWVQTILQWWMNKKWREAVHYINGPETLPAPLSAEEEARVMENIRNNVEGAREPLITHNLRLVVYISKKFESSFASVEDLISIGTIGLIKRSIHSVRREILNWQRMPPDVLREILMYLRKSTQLKHEISIDDPLNVDWDGNELLLSDVLGSDPNLVNQNIEKQVERDLLMHAVSNLSQREKTIMQLRFGLNQETEHTQKEVADTLGISQSYISRLEKRIMERLKKDLERVG